MPTCNPHAVPLRCDAVLTATHLHRRLTHRRRRLFSGLVAALASVAFHVLIVLPAVWGGSGPKVRLPDQQGAGSSSIASAEEPTDTLIIVHLAGITPRSTSPTKSVSSRGFASRDLLVTVASPDVAPAVDLSRELIADESEPMAEPAADQAGRRARLLGMYVGQVKARIERAWVRPRAPIPGGDAVFQCRVAIKQDRTGAVKTVELEQCNGDANWQESLMSAIFAASPLSAPPEPSIFASTLTLTLLSLPYATGRSEDGYERVSLISARNAAQGNHSSVTYTSAVDSQGAQYADLRITDSGDMGPPTSGDEKHLLPVASPLSGELADAPQVSDAEGAVAPPSNTQIVQ